MRTRRNVCVVSSLEFDADEIDDVCADPGDWATALEETATDTAVDTESGFFRCPPRSLPQVTRRYVFAKSYVSDHTAPQSQIERFHRDYSDYKYIMQVYSDYR